MHYLLTIIFLVIGSTIFAANSKQATDSLLYLLKSTPSSEKRIQIYRDLADIHTSTTKYKDYLLKMYWEAKKK